MRHDDRKRKQTPMDEQEQMEAKKENERKELVETFGMKTVKQHEKLLRKHEKREQRARAKHFVLVQQDVPVLSPSSASRLLLPAVPKTAKSVSINDTQQELFPNPTKEELALCEQQIAELLDSGITPCMIMFFFIYADIFYFMLFPLDFFFSFFFFLSSYSILNKKVRLFPLFLVFYSWLLSVNYKHRFLLLIDFIPLVKCYREIETYIFLNHNIFF